MSDSLPGTKRLRKIISTIFKKNDIKIHSTKTRDVSSSYSLPWEIRNLYVTDKYRLRAIVYKVDGSNESNIKKAIAESQTMIGLIGKGYTIDKTPWWGHHKDMTYKFYAYID
jgi:hypothetical protein